jgi:serine/threonine-protein kinase
MSDTDPDPDDLPEDLASWLAGCDEALAAGTTPSLADRADASPEIEHDLACMKLLRQVLPRPQESAATTLQVPAAQGPLPDFGRFQVRRELGRGGFGIVFLAYDPQLGREVALKVPRPDVLLTPPLRQRFLREGRAAAALEHPSVVPVYEAGEIGPLCYLVSAYCAGMTLAAWIKERDRAGLRPDPACAAALVAALAEAVAHAHSRGVLHRDLKPSNVLLEAAGEGKPPLPRVTDFGLAKLLDTEPGGESTHTGAVLGTPAYMAPEQAAGSRDVGPAADVWALGVILYELLTGRTPFQGATTVETLERVRNQDPLAPRALNPLLDRRLEAICLKCLEKAPARRYPSAQALADDLASWQVGGPILARPRSWLGRTLRRPAVRNVAAALLAGLGLVLATWAVLAVASRPASPLGSPPPEPEPERPPEPAELIRRDLAAGKPVTLVAATGLPAASRWRARGEAGSLTLGEDGTCSVRHAEGGLLELVPAVPCQRYRLRAEVRHDRVAFTRSEVGLYFLHSEHATEQGPTHCYYALAFNDLPTIGVEPVQLWVHQQPASWLDHQYFAMDDRESQKKRRRPFAFPMPGTKLWRQLTVEVEPERVRAFCGETCIAEPSSDELTALYRVMMREAGDPNVLAPTFAPGNGLGLYVREGTASFRSVVIEPLPAD